MFSIIFAHNGVDHVTDTEHVALNLPVILLVTGVFIALLIVVAYLLGNKPVTKKKEEEV